MLKFFLAFCLIFAGLFAFELAPLGQALLVTPWTAALAKLAAHVLVPLDGNIAAYGNVLVNPRNGLGISIMPGCNAVEASMILIAAMLAFPAPWRHKLLGILAGVVAVQAVNTLRIVSLYCLLQWRQDVFEFAHHYLWQALIMLDVLVVWLVWIRAMPRPARPAHGA